MSRRIVIPGGSGQVGTFLARALHAHGDDVVVLTRSPSSETPWRQVAWDGRERGAWCHELNGADAVINLAGRSVDCRYGPANRESITASRIESTRVLGEVIGECVAPPPVWLNASTATIYDHRYDAANDEATGILGPGTDVADAPHPDTWQFSIDVAKGWEAEFERAATPRTRKVALRMAIVMCADRGSVFDIYTKLVRRRIGGRIGDGRQFVSWIHEADLVRALQWLLEQDDMSGPVNLAAPEPLPQAEFMRVLREVMGVRLGLPATKWMLEIGTWLLRTESELVLKSRRVVPGRLLEAGFEFEFQTWRDAARELWSRMR